MVGLVLIGITISVFLLIWTKFNVSEHKSIGERWEKLMAAEDAREENYRKIKSAVVTKVDREADEIFNVLYYRWDIDANALWLYNAEDRAEAVYRLSEVTGVYFVREKEASE